MGNTPGDTHLKEAAAPESARQPVTDWLLEGPAWLRYAVELQLRGKAPDAAPALEDSAIAQIVSRLKDGQRGIPALKSGRVHYTDTGKAYWDLFLLSDIGFTMKDLWLESLAEEVFRFQAADGTFTIPPNVRDDYFCMSAILLSSLARMGYRDDPRLHRYIRAALAAQAHGGGWDCYGDGTDYQEACPMDNLNILMLLGQYEAYRESPGLHGALDLLLEHWATGAHLYGFGVGKRFRSLLYPAVKYGILRVLDVLSLFPHATGRPAFGEMLDFVQRQAVDGKYRAGAADAAYAEFDFGQTEAPSRWLTFLVNRIEKRAGLVPY